MPDDGHYLERELEELLRTDPSVFRFLERGSLDGIWYWNLEEPEDEWLSPRFKEVFGYGLDEIPHSSEWWQANIHPDDLPGVLATFEAHKADPSHPYDQVVRYRHKDGSQVWVRCRGLIIRDAEGVPKRMLGAHTDVTELKRAEARLTERNRELARSNEELEQVAHALAHDLKAPLRTASTYGRLLGETSSSGLSQDAKDYIRFIVDAAESASRMVDDLLALARVGGEDAAVSDVDLAEVLDDVRSAMAGRLAERDATLEVGRLGVVRGRPAQLRQLVANLLENAVKFSKGPPEISVTGRDEGDMHVLSVRDHGIGLAAGDATKIFEMFHRAHSGDGYEGTGMGLALCKKIVHRHGGDIRATGEEGVGATLEVRLPRSRGLPDQDG